VAIDQQVRHVLGLRDALDRRDRGIPQRDIAALLAVDRVADPPVDR
jgi:hypothetical protein